MGLDASFWVQRFFGDDSPRPNDVRNAYERDRSRVIHAASFRRLQGKTQLLGLAEGDFHRTRLTHSMEVAQIARGLVLQIAGSADPLRVHLPPLELIEAVAFSHDLGHPPFGHRGERALNFMMRDAGGFEGNGQSLRLVTRLEANIPTHGLNLTRRTLLGILKYPRPYSEVRCLVLPDAADRFAQVRTQDWKPPKCYLDTEDSVVQWLLAEFSESDRERFTALQVAPTDASNGLTAAKTLDCSIMELADDIAYGIHDLEDGIALKMIPIEAVNRVMEEIDSDWARSAGIGRKSTLSFELMEPTMGGNRKRAIGMLVHSMISSVTLRRLAEFQDPILGSRAVLHPEAKRILELLKDTASRFMIHVPSAQTLEWRGAVVVMSIFDALASDAKNLLTPNLLAAYNRATSPTERLRAVCDYVAGMTDIYATRIYERLFIPRQGSVFEQL